MITAAAKPMTSGAFSAGPRGERPGVGGRVGRGGWLATRSTPPQPPLRRRRTATRFGHAIGPRGPGAVEPACPVGWLGLVRAAFCGCAGIGRDRRSASPAALQLQSFKAEKLTHYMSVLTLAMFFGQLPLILLHESAHALAGRRLGVPSRLSIGRRL
jgi:hypothetical protein